MFLQLSVWRDLPSCHGEGWKPSLRHGISCPDIETFNRCVVHAKNDRFKEGLHRKRGDTLSEVAAWNGICMEALAEANNMGDGGIIQVGQRLIMSNTRSWAVLIRKLGAKRKAWVNHLVHIRL